MNQQTIARRVDATGIGIHKGKAINISLEPLGEDKGIVFCRSDCRVQIPLSITNVVNTSMATVIGKDSKNISTIEHLLSAIYAYEIDNVMISVDSDEIPIMDGSAISFCLLLNEAGIATQKKPRKIIKVLKKVEVRDGNKFASLDPDISSSFEFDIDFPHPAIKKQSHEYRVNRDTFADEIARARTFGFIRGIQALQSQNLALGASLSNAIGLDERKILNHGGLRYENEFARHKILDAMGDMMVTGYRVLGKYRAFASSHRLNHELTKELLSCSDNYELIDA